MFSKVYIAAPAVALALTVFSAAGRADTTPTFSPLNLLSSQVSADPVSQTITFALTFDRAPDLQTYNSYTNAADEFAIDILNEPLDHSSLMGAGGEDVRILSSQYRVTDSLINSGRIATPIGYSAITTPRYAGSLLLNLVPFDLTGSTVTITVPFGQLHETDGLFEGTLQTYRYGAWSGSTTEIGTVFSDPLAGAVNAPAPEPSSVALLGVSSLGLLLRRRKPMPAGDR